MKRTLLYYFWDFARALYKQLESDEERWGDEWKKRPIEATPRENLQEGQAGPIWAHQNDRVKLRIDEYYLDWVDRGIDMPWLKVAGLSMIAWVREHFPNYAKD